MENLEIEKLNVLDEFETLETIKVVNARWCDYVATLVVASEYKEEALAMLDLFDTPLELTTYTNRAFKAKVFENVQVYSKFKMSSYESWMCSIKGVHDGKLVDMLENDYKACMSHDASENLMIWCFDTNDIDGAYQIIRDIINRQNQEL